MATVPSERVPTHLLLLVRRNSYAGDCGVFVFLEDLGVFSLGIAGCFTAIGADVVVFQLSVEDMKP